MDTTSERSVKDPVTREKRTGNTKQTTVLTIGRKVALIVATTVVLGIGLMLVTSTNNQRVGLRETAVETGVTVAEILAPQVAGGVKWNKADRVGAVYADLVGDKDSTITNVIVWDGAGTVLSSYVSTTWKSLDLSNTLRTWGGRLDAGETVTRISEEYLIVATPILFGEDRERIGTMALAWTLGPLNDRVFEAAAAQVGIGIAVIVTLISMLLLSLSRTVTRPVKVMTDTMERLAAGDTEADVPGRGRGDEIGGMARAVQIFKENAIEKQRLEEEQVLARQRAEEEKRQGMLELADKFETSVKEVVDGVSSAATEMQATAQQMSATAEETSRQLTNVATASDQATANVQTVAATAEELSASIAEIGRQVMQSAKIASNAVSETEATNETVKGLAEAAGKIGEVVNLINDIAGQTNLLALNATIEAARAGEAGKGFAVVAQEVKNLANQTAKATEDISAQIGAVQEETAGAVSAIQKIGGIIDEISDISTTISSAVEEQGVSTQEIARNVQQAAKGTQDVNTSIESVNRAAGETGTAAGQVLNAAQEMSRQAEKLRSEVDVFLRDVKTA